MKIIIHTDGGVSPNPGLGTWTYLMQAIEDGKVLKSVHKSGVHPWTTNQRMELTAVIEALSALKRPAEVTVISDSEYVVKGMSEWLSKWKAKNWRTSKGAVMNKDLWEQLDDLASVHTIDWQWTRGHADSVQNNFVDALCTQTRNNAQSPEYQWVFDMTSGEFFIEKYSVLMSGEYDKVLSMGIIEPISYKRAVEIARSGS